MSDAVDEIAGAIDAGAPVQVQSESRESDDGKHGPSQATIMIGLALKSGAELFHSPDGIPYATLPIAGHKETWRLRSDGVKTWLRGIFYRSEGKAAGGQAVSDALGALDAQAIFDGPELPVYTRLAAHDGNIYLDLADGGWRCIEIAPSGWRVCTDAPIRFVRPRGMLALPEPVHGGSLMELRDFLNVADDDDWRLAVGWLLGALRPTGPYPVLVIHGEQGSAKTTQCRVLRRLVDPNVADLRSEPRDERDLAIAARNGWVVGLDHLSRLPDWLSDAICRLATGGGLGKRELYTDAEEVVIEVTRPVLLNGIEELATRGDLLDRAIVLWLQPIPEGQRRDEKKFWAAFRQAQPRILGALYDALSGALRNESTVDLKVLPRMADFAVWVTAAEPALGWPAGAFLASYAGNRRAANDLSLEGSVMTGPLRALMDTCETWTGTATELLAELTQRVDEQVRKHRAWPGNGRALSNLLRRLAANLRADGLAVDFSQEPHTRRRLVTIRKGTQICVPSVPSVPSENETAASGYANDGRGTQNGISPEVCVPGFPDAGYAKHVGDAKIPISPNGHVPPVSDVAAAAADDWREIL